MIMQPSHTLASLVLGVPLVVACLVLGDGDYYYYDDDCGDGSHYYVCGAYC